METVRVSVSFYVTGEMDLDSHLDQVMTALMAIETADDRISDSDYVATVKTGFVRINSSATAETFELLLPWQLFVLRFTQRVDLLLAGKATTTSSQVKRLPNTTLLSSNSSSGDFHVVKSSAAEIRRTSNT